MDILQRAAQAADAGELYEELREGLQVSFRGGEIERVASQAVLGRALRVISNGKLGFASTAGEEADGLVKAALASAAHGDAAPFSFPTPASPNPVEVLDPQVESTTVDELVTWGEQAVHAVGEAFPEVIVDVSLAKGTQDVRLANTAGGELRERRSYLTMSLEAQWIREGDIYLVWQSRAVRRRADLDPERLTASLLRYLRWGERVAVPPARTPPVVFTPQGATVLLLPLLMGFSGLSVHMGTSPLQGKLGQQVFHPSLTLTDEGGRPFAPGSRSFDDEGLPVGTLPLVEAGVARNFFYDLRTAALAGAEPTGNGTRSGLLRGGGFRTPPSPGPRNIVLQPEEGSLEDFVADISEGMVVAGVLGLGQGNVASGAFSNNVGVGFAVRDGKVVGRVKGTMIAGNAYQVLRDGLKQIGGEPEWVFGTALLPALLVEGVHVVTR
ncbi:MAG: TldD/PmbA family protein [Candidatus Bipolaricaulaceae bacterium]